MDPDINPGILQPNPVGRIGTIPWLGKRLCQSGFSCSEPNWPNNLQN
jgi:hypothetical protein